MLNMMNLLSEIIEYERSKDEELDARCRQNEERIAMETAIKLKAIEAENEAIMAWFEQGEVEVLLDKVEHIEKPQAKETARITKALPENRVKVSIPQFASFIERGCSFKASVLSGTTKDSFVSSNIVALDVDNKESYTTIDEFMNLTTEAQLKPFMLYETFSSKPEHERFRVLYRFNVTITDAEEMEKLYNYVWNLFPTVDLDYSVDHSKILYGGKRVAFHNNSINEVPDLSNVSLIRKSVTKAQPKQRQVISEKHITPEQIKANLEALRPQFEGQVMNAKEMNENIKLTDLLNVSLGERFRCVLPNHDDMHPSARIIEDKDNSNEQVYMCTCHATGNRVIGIYAKIFGVSNTTAFKEMSDILGTSRSSEYQRKAKDHIDTLYDNYDELMDPEVARALNNKHLTAAYLLFLRVARTKAISPVSNNENDIAIHVSNEYLTNQMIREGIPGAKDISRKMAEMCRLGLLKKLTDEEIKPESLKKSKEVGKYNHVDYYCILDLTQERIDFIKDMLAHDKAVGYRQYGTNAQRRINACGYTHIRQNVNVQGYSKKTDTLVLKAVESLIESGVRYFSEDDINKEMRRKNHKINKKDAQLKILNFLPDIVEGLDLNRIRVNKKTRKQYSIGKNYKSNSIVYTVDSSGFLDDLEEIL